mmetsp:Transcript_21329/g.48174  ORF Transcript_21329/g.48174 Transcript_21329/m.48174 type:complete len:217 (+) Transcript_21329:1612-2262(+)|eukprot:140472-Hanusia_phi.AAC.1
MATHASNTEVVVSSFSFKTGAPEANLVVDVRFLPDPRPLEQQTPSLTGKDSLVEDYIREKCCFDSFFAVLKQKVSPIVGDLLGRGQQRIEFAFGCTAGKHRSVFVAECLAEWLRQEVGINNVRVLHRELSPRSHDEMMNSFCSQADVGMVEDEALNACGPVLRCTYYPDSNSMDIQEMSCCEHVTNHAATEKLLGCGLSKIAALRAKRRRECETLS